MSAHIKNIVANMVDALAPKHMKVDEIVLHPDGRSVKIIDGCYLDPIYHRVSNWWTWREVLVDGTLGKEESGYGW